MSVGWTYSAVIDCGLNALRDHRVEKGM